MSLLSGQLSSSLSVLLVDVEVERRPSPPVIHSTPHRDFKSRSRRKNGARAHAVRALRRPPPRLGSRGHIHSALSVERRRGAGRRRSTFASSTRRGTAGRWQVRRSEAPRERRADGDLSRGGARCICRRRVLKGSTCALLRVSVYSRRRARSRSGPRRAGGERPLTPPSAPAPSPCAFDGIPTLRWSSSSAAREVLVSSTRVGVTFAVQLSSGASSSGASPTAETVGCRAECRLGGSASSEVAKRVRAAAARRERDPERGGADRLGEPAVRQLRYQSRRRRDRVRRRLEARPPGRPAIGGRRRRDADDFASPPSCVILRRKLHAACARGTLGAAPPRHHFSPGASSTAGTPILPAPGASARNRRPVGRRTACARPLPPPRAADVAADQLATASLAGGHLTPAISGTMAGLVRATRRPMSRAVLREQGVSALARGPRSPSPLRAPAHRGSATRRRPTP